MSDFVEVIWLWAVCMLLIFTVPIWFIPYTAYRAWRFFKEST